MRMRSILFLFVALMFIAPMTTGCLVYHKPSFKGQVLDAETKQPIEGAVVVVEYSRDSLGLGAGSISSIINARETLTDRDGMFKISSYTTLIHALSRSSLVRFIIFKPGYGTFPLYQSVPEGIRGKDHEMFFSEDFETVREIELSRGSVGEGTGPRSEKFNIPFGIVELPKARTKEERRQAWMAASIFGPAFKFEEDLPILRKMVTDERKNWP